jgi:hypothetical protein
MDAIKLRSASGEMLVVSGDYIINSMDVPRSIKD